MFQAKFIAIARISINDCTPWREIKATIREWVRVLKPGGKIRIVTPSLRFICDAFVSNSDLWKKGYEIMAPEEAVALADRWRSE